MKLMLPVYTPSLDEYLPLQRDVRCLNEWLIKGKIHRLIETDDIYSITPIKDFVVEVVLRGDAPSFYTKDDGPVKLAQFLPPPREPTINLADVTASQEAYEIALHILENMLGFNHDHVQRGYDLLVRGEIMINETAQSAIVRLKELFNALPEHVATIIKRCEEDQPIDIGVEHAAIIEYAVEEHMKAACMTDFYQSAALSVSNVKPGLMHMGAIERSIIIEAMGGLSKKLMELKIESDI